MIIGSLLTFVTLDMLRKYSIDALVLGVLIGSLIANVVAIIIGVLILLGMIVTGITWLKRKLK
jgi:uncharacterized protein (DUF2062 family)